MDKIWDILSSIMNWIEDDDKVAETFKYGIVLLGIMAGFVFLLYIMLLCLLLFMAFPAIFFLFFLTIMTIMVCDLIDWKNRN